MSDAHVGSQVPFVELLRDVPVDFCATRDTAWLEDGTPCMSHHIPVGRMFHDAANEIMNLREESNRHRRGKAKLREALSLIAAVRGSPSSSEWREILIAARSALGVKGGRS